jgi:hypothetical protein
MISFLWKRLSHFSIPYKSEKKHMSDIFAEPDLLNKYAGTEQKRT